MRSHRPSLPGDEEGGLPIRVRVRVRVRRAAFKLNDEDVSMESLQV